MRWIGAVLLFLALLAPAVAQDAGAPAPTPVVVRQSLDPASGAVIGQHVALYVDVMFAGEMPRPPRVDLPEAPGLQAFRFETQATTMRDTIGGTAYVGQRFEFALYARRGGAFEVPAAQVTLLDRQGEPTGTAQGQPIPLEVRVPPGVDASGPVVATKGLTLTERWEPDPKGPFKAGGAIVRTITRTAEDMPSLAMRDLAFPAPEGVRVYADPPDSADRIDRGVLTGRRTDRVTYVFERGGRVELPAVAQPWWDLSANALKTAQGAGVTLDVAAAPAAAPESGAPKVPLALLALIAGAAVLLLALVGFGIHTLRRRQTKAGLSEDEAFAALRDACAGGEAGAVYRALGPWRGFLSPDRDAAVTRAAGGLDAALFASAASRWDTTASQDFFNAIKQIRGAPSPGHGYHPLPPLNP